jgi:uncharacterized protein (TIGR02285 family)
MVGETVQMQARGDRVGSIDRVISSVARCGLTICFLIFQQPILANDKIVWMLHQQKPPFIAAGPLAGQGFGDQQVKMFFGELRQFDHVVTRGSFARIFHQIGQEDGVCTHLVYKSPEREKIALFSARPIKVFGLRLFVVAENDSKIAPFVSDGEVDLDRLMSETDMLSSFGPKRALPEALVTAIGHARQTPMTPMTPEQEIKLLAAGRIDFMVGHPNETAYLQRLVPVSLKQYPIKDVVRIAPLYTACSKGPLGQQVIDILNRLQAQPKMWGAMIEAMRQWTTAEELAASRSSVAEY